MNTMFVQSVFLVTLGITCLIDCSWSYGYGGYAPTYEAVPSLDDSYANTVANIAAAKASASRISSVNWPVVHYYGYQIGKPLLVKDYGQLTSLYSALAPKRSFVGTIDSGFYKDAYGKVKFRDETSVGAIVV